MSQADSEQGGAAQVPLGLHNFINTYDLSMAVR